MSLYLNNIYVINILHFQKYNGVLPLINNKLFSVNGFTSKQFTQWVPLVNHKNITKQTIIFNIGLKKKFKFLLYNYDINILFIIHNVIKTKSLSIIYLFLFLWLHFIIL